MATRRRFIQCGGAAAVALSVAPTRELLGAEAKLLPVRPIPGSGESLPIVGLGNARAFYEGDLELSRRLLEILLDHGGSYVDTSGESRFTIGRIVNEKNAHQQTFLGTYTEEKDGRAARTDLETVIDAQGGEPLDLVLTRFVADFSSRRADFRGLKGDGLTRYVGVARHQAQYHEAMMRLMRDGAVDFVQVNYSILEPEAEERLLPMARDEGVAIITNRPFINGEWFSLVKGRPLPEWAAEFDCASWAQFSLKFILSHPAVTCVLTETSNPRHAVDNLGGGLGRLPDEDTRKRMRALVQSFA